jgi:ketosteroid isomerase-like protein
MSTRVDDWKAAWESRDVARIAAMYAPDATHARELVPRFLPEAGCRGRDQIAEYFRRASGCFRELRFDLDTVTEDATRSAVSVRTDDAPWDRQADGNGI